MSELSGEVLGAGGELGSEEPALDDAASEPRAKTSSGDEEHVTDGTD
jgi:hypothetical protein